jgi:hypothetical protein
MSGGDYEVGYGRPPKDWLWKKGTSGNPLGRKPRSKTVGKRAPHPIFDGKIELHSNGRPRRVSRINAALLKLFSSGMGGDGGALKAFVEAFSKHDRLIAMRPEIELIETQLPSIIFVPVEARPALDADWSVLPPPRAEAGDG